MAARIGDRALKDKLLRGGSLELYHSDGQT
jgi:hypothetical protein